MGSRVPYDLCEPVYDKEAYNKALATYNPKIHKTVAQAVLAYHRVKPIYGLSVTRNDYIDLAKFHINEVYPDGRKVMLDNPFPRFFDISFVFIGAEPPAKVMLKLAGQAKKANCKDGKCDLFVSNGEIMKTAAKKTAKDKKSTIDKATPSTFTPKATGQLMDNYPDMDKKTLDSLGQRPVEHSLATTGLSGIILKPHEFQRIVLVRIGKKDLADKLDEEGKVFSPVEEIGDMPPISHDDFMPHIFSIIRDLLPFRSVFAPFHETPIRIRRIITIVCRPRQQVKDELLDKISAAYNGYRKRLYEAIEKEAALAISAHAVLRGELMKFGQTYITPQVLDIFRKF
ncbi:MAG: hypothetical protein DRJ35_07550 [Thermoprotei archaeon]|nr:MAG: hypothetical protein DRJ35_07550 [Thermoprotei archaeon]